MQINGRIVSLQEQRFRLRTADGQAYLLTLGRHARLDASALAEWRDRGTLLSVDFRGEPNLTGCVAQHVTEDGR